MWFRRSELLAPLTSLTSSKVKFEWHSSHQHPFDKIKIFIGNEIKVLLYYPGFNKPFLIHLYTDASGGLQLGAVIMQDKNPKAFYSRKLNKVQKWYKTTERHRESLSAIKTCKKYKNILLGCHETIIVFIDHKNNTFSGLKASDRIYDGFYSSKNME
jgi:hypothetical protein